MRDNGTVDEIHYWGQIHFAACSPKLGNVANKDGVGLVWSELAVKLFASNATDGSCVGSKGLALTDFGPKAHLANELVDEFAVDQPAFITQVRQHLPVAVAMLVAPDAS